MNELLQEEMMMDLLISCYRNTLRTKNRDLSTNGRPIGTNTGSPVYPNPAAHILSFDKSEAMFLPPLYN